MAARRVSVALGTYNGARYLAEQLRSIGSQSVPVDEIVVADDGSTDSTLAILDSLRSSLPPVRLLDDVGHQGVTRNFERAIAATEGAIVLLSDQDDRWHPERVARALTTFDDPSVILVHSDARIVDADGALLHETLLDRLRVGSPTRAALQVGDAFPTLLQRNVVTGATLAFRRELLDQAIPFPDGWLHDEWLAVLAASIDGTRLLAEELIDYRVHGGNEVGATRVTWSERFSRLGTPRTERDRRLLIRARALRDRLPAGGRRDDADAKVAHEEARSAYPDARAARLFPVMRESRTGRYERFGRGRDDILRDLVQPV